MADRVQNWRSRVSALALMPQDIGAPIMGSAIGVRDHERLFDYYVRGLLAARAEAESWWEGLIAVRTSRVGDRVRAEAEIRHDWPVGPCAHGKVVAVLREAWLACADLNEGLHEAERLGPEVLTLIWLMSREEELAQFLSKLPYLPIGRDMETSKWL